jgi:hypothetical protein
MIDFLFVLSILVAWAIVLLFWAKRSKPELEISPEVQDILSRVTNETLIILEVEPINDQFLCYNYFTKEFVCTGRNIEEIRDQFEQRYPNKEAAVAKGDPAALSILKQQLKVLHENSTSI